MFNTPGGANNQLLNFSVDFARVFLRRHVPHLLLVGTRNRLAFPLANYQMQTLKLEGKFADYFTLYAPPKYQIDALQLFTPDVMSALIPMNPNPTLDNPLVPAADYIFELIDDQIYVYAPEETMLKTNKLQRLFKTLADFAQELGFQAENYTDDRVRGDAVAKANHWVAKEGARLKQRKIAWSTILFTVLGVLLVLALIGARIWYLVQLSGK
jgi:hypothetical protein